MSDSGHWSELASYNPGDVVSACGARWIANTASETEASTVVHTNHIPNDDSRTAQDEIVPTRDDHFSGADIQSTEVIYAWSGTADSSASTETRTGYDTTDLWIDPITQDAGNGIRAVADRPHAGT